MNLVLLDLDGALLGLKAEVLREAFLTELEPYWRETGREELAASFRRAREQAAEDTDLTVNNRQAFLRAFASAQGVEEQACADRMEDFYQSGYAKLAGMIEKNETAIALVRAIREKGFDIALVTDALDPLSAVEDRLIRAGLDESEFIFIATSENMHFGRTHARFYREIMEKCSVYPEDCMMVSSDPADPVPRRLGIPTYMIADGEAGCGGEGTACDWKGSRCELTEMFLRGDICRS